MSRKKSKVQKTPGKPVKTLIEEVTPPLTIRLVPLKINSNINETCLNLMTCLFVRNSFYLIKVDRRSILT